MTRSKENPRSYLIGYKLREIEAESKFSQELTLACLERIVPQAMSARVLAAEGLQTERERKLNLLVTVLLIIMINIYTTDSIGAVLEKIAQGLRYIWPENVSLARGVLEQLSAGLLRSYTENRYPYE